MSLDVYLTVPGTAPRQIESAFIRENGVIREISESEWEDRFPDAEYPSLYSSTVFDADKRQTRTAYSANITHNLNTMAEEAGIYRHLWRPEEIGITKAGQLIEPLEEGLRLLLADPQRFEKHNPSNGWGDYRGLVQFVQSYLAACQAYPDADIQVSR